MKLSVITWNINSVRLRMPIVEQLLKEYSPDVLCLQETKVTDALFPGKAVTGDFNVAPLQTDVWSHEKLKHVVTHTTVEIERLAALRASTG